MAKNKNMGKWARRIVIYFVVILCMVLAVIPVFWVAIMSIKTNLDIYTIPPKLIFTPTGEQFHIAFTNMRIFSNLVNSLIVATINTILSVTIGSLAAFSLLRLKSSRTKDIALWALSLRVVPPVTLLIPYYILFRNIHLIDTRTALILVYLTFNLPFALWMMRSYLKSIPVAIEEMAMVDGCTRLRAFLKVTLPLAKPGLTATALFCFIFSWNEFLFSFTLTGRDAITLPRMLTMAITHKGIIWGQLAAMCVIMISPIIVLCILLQKHIVRGLTAGAIRE